MALKKTKSNHEFRIRSEKSQFDLLSGHEIFVVAVDDSSCSKRAMEWADYLANKNDELHVIHVNDPKSNLERVQKYYKNYESEHGSKITFEILRKVNHTDDTIKSYVNDPDKLIDYLVTGLYGASFENKRLGYVCIYNICYKPIYN